MNNNFSPSRRALAQRQQQQQAGIIAGIPGRQPHPVQYETVPMVFISWAVLHFVIYFWLSMW